MTWYQVACPFPRSCYSSPLWWDSFPFLNSKRSVPNFSQGREGVSCCRRVSFCLLVSNFLQASHVSTTIWFLLTFQARRCILLLVAGTMPRCEESTLLFICCRRVAGMITLSNIILNKPTHSSATDALAQLGWVSIDTRRKFHRLLLVFKVQMA